MRSAERACVESADSNPVTKETAVKLSAKKIQRNTDDLLAYFAKKRAEAEAEPNATFRASAVKTARDAEWHTLFSCLLVDSMRPLYDGVRIGERIDAMLADLRAPRGDAHAA